MRHNALEIASLRPNHTCEGYARSTGLRCGKQSIYDNAAFFSCPRPYDDPGKVYCCGGGKLQGGSYCCTQIEHGINKIGDR